MCLILYYTNIVYTNFYLNYNIMTKSIFSIGGGKTYLSPTIEVTEIAIERGFEASLPGISTEDGEGWGEY